MVEKESTEKKESSRELPDLEFRAKEGFEEVEKYWIEEPFAFVAIFREEETGNYRYELFEPALSDSERDLIQRVWVTLKDRLPYEAEDEMDRDILIEELRKIAERHEVVDLDIIDKFSYYIERDRLGYGRIDALLRDPGIEDVSCNGAGEPLFVYHRAYGSIETNLTFDKEELDHLIGRLADKCGKSISYASPIMEARLPEGPRVQAILGSEVTTKGSSFTIRKFLATFTPADLIRLGTFNAEMLAYLWFAIENGRSILITGGAASGKTSTLNALGFFIPPNAKIVSIEDTRELSFFQKNWVPNLTRGGARPIEMFELIQKALRQRPDYLVVGEVRGTEASALFQGMSMGHKGFTTMHADSIQSLVNRLKGDPINIFPPMLAELDIVCLQLLTPLDGEIVRRGKQVVEFAGLEPETEEIQRVEIFRWNRGTDSFMKLEESPLMKEIGEEIGLNKEELSEELERREEILRYLAKKPELSPEDVASLLELYSFYPEKVMERVTVLEKIVEALERGKEEAIRKIQFLKGREVDPESIPLR